MIRNINQFCRCLIYSLLFLEQYSLLQIANLFFLIGLEIKIGRYLSTRKKQTYWHIQISILFTYFFLTLTVFISLNLSTTFVMKLIALNTFFFKWGTYEQMENMYNLYSSNLKCLNLLFLLYFPVGKLFEVKILEILKHLWM